MTEEQIQAKLDEFADKIFYECRTKKEALELKRRLNQFEKENSVTFEQLQPFAESGAGEVLHMLITAPIDQ